VLGEAAILVLGILGLWLGSVIAVDGGRNLALHFRISPAFVGLTLLSIGTSVPEISVSLAGGFDRLHGVEASGVVVGSCVGSAINQLSILLGVVAVVGPLKVTPHRLRREGLRLISAVAVLGLLGSDGELSVADGWILILLYAIYLLDLLREERVRVKVPGRRPALHLALDLLRLGAGILLVGFSSDRVVGSSVTLAEVMGWSQTFIGISIVGLGTGLPELAISLAAVRRGEVEMSTSNLLGSNLCDLLFSLGAGTVVAGFMVPATVLYFDLPALLLITLLVVALFRRDFALRRSEGLGLVASYLVYLTVRLVAFG
jgi:cation:H+ antiporter